MNLLPGPFRSDRAHSKSVCVSSMLLIALIGVGMPAYAISKGPTIRLFPTTVVEDLRLTSSVAREMESGLQEVIGRLDQQQQLYQENTRLSLEKRLRSELGNKMTPWMLQETLIGGSPQGQPTAAPKLRGRSGMRLSERFKQYYQLVSSSGSQSDQSLAVLAADVYLDMDETSVLIARTREEIARATLMEQLNQSFGIVTPEMMEVVGGVKSILFGDTGSNIQIAGPPPGQIEQAYRSPLEN
jgi:hypothetical protein